MENASKALIIAGAILISIVIITLGVMIVNNVRGTIADNSNLSAQEVAMYNAEFESYMGEFRTGSQVKSLIKAVKSHNNVNDDDSKIILLKYLENGETVSVSSLTGLGSLSSVGEATPTPAASNYKGNTLKDITDEGWNKKDIIASNALVEAEIKTGYTYNVTYDTAKSGMIIKITIDRVNK